MHKLANNNYNKIARRLMNCFLLVGLLNSILSAQTYPINVTTQLIGGFTGYMEDYTSPVNEQLRILVTQYDLTKPTYNVHFKVRIEGPNILIESKANYYSDVFYIDPGVPQQITGSDLAGLLNAENLNFSGINKTTYQTKALPEGFYSFCFTAYDGTSVSKAQVSNASCAMSYFSKSDPPFLNLPLCGSELKPTDPQQITFSWTPMHMGSINAFNTVDYLFELFEVRPSGQNINNIVQTSVPVFSTTTNLTMLNYGIAETPLIPGMQYVWRVRAVESSGKESFKNNGFSQVCSFNYGSKYDGIDIKIKLNAIGLLPEVIKAYWDTLDIYNNYHLFISKVNGNGTWREFKTKKGEQYINIVEPECTYKLYVIGDLDEGGQGKASDTVLVTTPAVKKIVCNDLPPPPPPENGDPLTTASVGMIWSIGQFRMEVLTLENTASPNGRYTGTGKIELLPGYMIAHYFENIRMNNLMQMTHGVVMAESTGMDNWREKKRNAEQGGDDTGDEITGAVTTDAIISGTISDIKVTNNNDSTATITVTTSEGDKTFENQSLPFTVIDGEGNIFFADKDGTAGKAAKANYLPPLNTKQLDTLSSIGLATFTAHSNQNYGFDSYQDIFAGKSIVEKEYQVLSSKFEVLSTKNQQPTTSNYRVPQKSIKASGYDKVNVSITLNDKNLNADSVVFVSSKGTQFLKLNVNSSTLSGNTQPITNNSSTYNFALALVGGPADDAQNIYALYKNGSTLKSIGKIKVAGYQLQKKKIVLVPVEKVQGTKYNVPSVAEIQKQLNNIYKSACIEYSVKIDSAFTTSALGADGTLDVTGSGLFSQYTEEMKALNKAYRLQHKVDKASIYLFILPVATDASVVGDMPRGKQFGYLFADALKNDVQAWTNTIAHEAAHGAGKLKHTFDADINLPEKTTSNLMDYNNGINLYKYQWDQLQDPGELTALFDEDEDAMMLFGEDFKKWLSDKIGFECYDTYKDFEGLIPQCVWNNSFQELNPSDGLEFAYVCGFIDGGFIAVKDAISMLQFLGCWSLPPTNISTECMEVRIKTIETVKTLKSLLSTPEGYEQFKNILAKQFGEWKDETFCIDRTCAYNTGKLMFDVASLFIGVGEVKAVLKGSITATKIGEIAAKTGKTGTALIKAINKGITKIKKVASTTYLYVSLNGAPDFTMGTIDATRKAILFSTKEAKVVNANKVLEKYADVDFIEAGSNIVEHGDIEIVEALNPASGQKVAFWRKANSIKEYSNFTKPISFGGAINKKPGEIYNILGRANPRDGTIGTKKLYDELVASGVPEDELRGLFKPIPKGVDENGFDWDVLSIIDQNKKYWDEINQPHIDKIISNNGPIRFIHDPRLAENQFNLISETAMDNFSVLARSQNIKKLPTFTKWEYDYLIKKGFVLTENGLMIKK